MSLKESLREPIGTMADAKEFSMQDLQNENGAVPCKAPPCRGCKPCVSCNQCRPGEAPTAKSK